MVMARHLKALSVEFIFSCLDDRGGLIQRVAFTTILDKDFIFLPKQIPSKLDLGT
jgi:hypothetical protein